MTPQVRKPWWKRKRWIAAAVLWLVIAYPLSLGPVAYGLGRGWLTKTHVQFVYFPVLAAAEALRPHPTIGLGPPQADGTRPYLVVPDPNPPPRIGGKLSQGYLDILEWFADLGKSHAG